MKAANRLGQGTRARLPVGGRVAVHGRVRFYGGRIGTVSEYNGDEIGVRFAPGVGAVWFRAADLIGLVESRPYQRTAGVTGRGGTGAPSNP